MSRAVNNPAGSGTQRPTLIFLHGIGGTAAGFEQHQQYFQQRGWPAIAWDQPGYGGKPAISPYSLASVARELLATLDESGIAHCVPVGHSMGGMLAQELYAIAPQRITALVLAHTSPAFGSPAGDFQKRFVEERTRPLDEGLSMADVAARVVPGMLGSAQDSQAYARACALMASVPAQTYRLAVNALVSFDQRAQLPSIHVPTLCLAAEHDRTAPPAVLEKMATKIPGGRYVCLPGLGHLAPIENPLAFCEAIEHFMANI